MKNLPKAGAARPARSGGLKSAGQSIFDDRFLRFLVQKDLGGDFEKAFGKLWPAIDAFCVQEGLLRVVAGHPAVQWELRLRKREMLEHLKIHGINNVQVDGKIY